MGVSFQGFENVSFFDPLPEKLRMNFLLTPLPLSSRSKRRGQLEDQLITMIQFVSPLSHHGGEGIEG
jgi:hypothetical protein